MTVDTRTSELIPMQLPRTIGNTSEQPQRAPRPATRPDPARILRILRRADVCAPLTDIEIAEAAKRRDRSGRLLAAAALHHMRAAQGVPDVGFAGHDLLAYLSIESANAGLDDLRGTRHISQKERNRLRSGWENQLAENTRAAAGFSALLSAANVLADEFDNLYAPNGKLNSKALGELYDQTDGINHPAFGALPNANTYGDKDPRRDAVVQAGRLLHYMVSRAMPSPPTEGV